MKSKLVYTIGFLVIVLLNVSAQKKLNSISGIVLDNATNEALPNVNIYISNTTWGTTTQIDGSFRLEDIIPGNHEMVFSMIGYDTHAQLIKIADSSNLYLNIRLIPKIYKISDITITADRPEEWYEDLEVFKKRFLGYSPYNINCIITNPYLINFSHPYSSILMAESEYPIEIINYDLGYKITCEIKEFKYDETLHKLNYTYRLFYTDLDTCDIEVKKDWEINRTIKYEESLAYFVRTLIKGNFREEGYDLALVYKPGFDGLDILDSKKILKKMDTEKNYKIEFQDYLRVNNQNIKFDEMRTSWIKLNYPSITLDEYGYPLEKNAITLLGYWSQLGVANFLPKYYGSEKSD